MNITFTGADNKKYTFLHIPKVAGRSITLYIMKHAKSYKTHHSNTHATLQDLKELKIDLGKTIAVFRNPYSRAVSLYKFLFKNNLNNFLNESLLHFDKGPDLEWFNNIRQEYANITFYKFCKNIDNMPLKVRQSEFYPVNIAFKIETLSTDIKILQTILGVTEPLLHLNKSDDNSWIEYYDNSSKELIRNYYKKDFKKLNYPEMLNNSSS
jgi:hypothetical protein